jgi:hypothetical protein
MLDFDHKETNIAAGEAAGRAAVPQFREVLARAAASKRTRSRAPASPAGNVIPAEAGIPFPRLRGKVGWG